MRGKTRDMRGKTRDVCGKHAMYVTMRGTRDVRDNAGEVGTVEGERELGNDTCWRDLGAVRAKEIEAR